MQPKQALLPVGAGKKKTAAVSLLTAAVRVSSGSVRVGGLHHLRDVGGAQAFLALLCPEFHDIVFRQGFEAFPLNRGMMHEHVLASVVRGDESKPLLVLEPSHRSPGPVERLLNVYGPGAIGSHVGPLQCGPPAVRAIRQLSGKAGPICT